MTTQQRQPRLTGATWRKASRSTTNGACVEIAHGTSVFGVRDSKNPNSERLILPATAWTGFVTAIKAQHDL